MSNSSTVNINLNFLNILTIVFVIMKCMGYINWSWWLVFSPTILSVTLVILFFIIVAFANK